MTLFTKEALDQSIMSKHDAELFRIGGNFCRVVELETNIVICYVKKDNHILIDNIYSLANEATKK